MLKFLFLSALVLAGWPTECGFCISGPPHLPSRNSILLTHTQSGQDFAIIHRGAHWIWVARKDQYQAHQAEIESFYDYADQACDQLIKYWGRDRAGTHYLLVYEKTGGGFATGDIGEVHQLTGQASPGIGVSYDAFYNEANGIKGYWAYAIITHEMVNSFTGEVGHGGWPRDWWADDRSPFPLMTAVEIELRLKPEVAVQHLRDGLKDPLVGMFLDLHDQYGWSMFRKAFRLAIEDGIDWNRIGTNPSAIRTNYVAAYLQMGAPENIASTMQNLVPGFDESVVKDIIRSRGIWTALPSGDSRYGELKTAYLKGDYAASLR